MFAIAILFVILLLIYFVYNNEYKKYNRHMDKFCGLPDIPLLGSEMALWSRKDFLPKTEQWMLKYQETFKVRLSIIPHLVVCDVKGSEFFLSHTSQITKSLQYNFFKRWLKNGLLVSTGSYWRRHRKIITPAFHFSILEQFVEIFNSCGDKLIKNLKGQVGKTSFDVFPIISLCTLDVMCEAAMGISLNVQENSQSEYVTSVLEMGRIYGDRSLSAWKMFDVFYKLSSSYRRELKVLEVLHGYSRKVIQKKKQEMKSTSDCASADEFGIRKRRAFLDLLLHASLEDGNALTDEEIQEEVDTFMFEGHDTTSSALSFCLYCFANYPDVQAKAVEELNHIFADDLSRDCTFKDIQAMRYLEMVVKETLRLYPSVPIYGREITEDIVYDGKIIPKGCVIMISSYLLHRNPQVYPNPLKFDPERFADNRSRSPYAYIPFSAGMRNCIGQKFAMAEIKTILSKILRRYELLPITPKHELQLSFDTVMKSANGVLLRIRERHQQ